jgi:hypothetical protein
MSKEYISDGYHTFDELYEHRHVLFMNLCGIVDNAWKSKKHSDGSMWDGWFIAGINIEKGKQITYHIPIRLWNDFRVRELEFAPEWDGHTSDDVIERLKGNYPSKISLPPKKMSKIIEGIEDVYAVTELGEVDVVVVELGGSSAISLTDKLNEIVDALNKLSQQKDGEEGV